jgi:hypothetical protein
LKPVRVVTGTLGGVICVYGTIENLIGRKGKSHKTSARVANSYRYSK